MTLRAPPRIRGPRKRGGCQNILAERSAWIIAKSKEGFTSIEIAEGVGISPTQVRRIIIDNGEMKTVASAPQPLPVPRTFITDFRDALSNEARRWLLENCPDGVTMGAFIASIVTDAHAEEMDAGTR